MHGYSTLLDPDFAFTLLVSYQLRLKQLSHSLVSQTKWWNVSISKVVSRTIDLKYSKLKTLLWIDIENVSGYYSRWHTNEIQILFYYTARILSVPWVCQTILLELLVVISSFDSWYSFDDICMHSRRNMMILCST